MKYFTVVLNLTLMFSSVESLRPLPFIILINISIKDETPHLPTVGWQNPFDMMTPDEFASLCDQERTLQRIKFSWTTHEAIRKPVHLYLTVEDNSWKIQMYNRKEKIWTTADGRPCDDKKQFIMKNLYYEGYFLFVSYSHTDYNNMGFIGIITNHLSYEDAGNAAFGLLGNSQNAKELERVWICSSLFQALSRFEVQYRESYYIKTFSTGENNRKLLCKGVKNLNNNTQPFITYVITLDKFSDTDTITVTLKKEDGILTEIRTEYMKYITSDIQRMTSD